jgi:hypothetical protein
MSNSDSPLNIDDFPRASFFRRLAAMVYDSLVATAVFMIAAIVFTLLRLWVRLFTSLLGLGTLLCLFDRKQKLALQDRASQTEMLVLTKSANDHKNWR